MNYKRNWKSRLVDYDFIQSIVEEPSRCITISATTLYMLITQLEPLSWLTRWYSPSEAEISQSQIELWSALAAKELMSNEECIEVSNNPCCPDLINAVNRLYVLSLQQHDDGTAQSFAPDAPDTFSGDTGQSDAIKAKREAALCGAVVAYVVATMQAVYTAALGTTYTAGFLIAIASFAGQYWLAGIIAAIAGAAALTEEIATDTAAIRRVICAMYDGLKGKTVTQENFAASLTGVLFESGGNAEIIRGIINACNHLPDNYRAFVSGLHNNYLSMPANSDSSSCLCCDDRPELALWPDRPENTPLNLPGTLVARIDERTWRFRSALTLDGYDTMAIHAVGDCCFCIEEIRYYNTSTGLEETNQNTFADKHEKYCSGSNNFDGNFPLLNTCYKGLFFKRYAYNEFEVVIKICEAGCAIDADCYDCPAL